MESRAKTRQGTVLALCAGLLLTVSACGPTADQLRDRQAAASRSPSVPPVAAPARPRPAPVPSTEPAPSPSPSQSPVDVTGRQAGMPQAVQDACQWMLRRDPGPMPGPEAGTCVSAAMAAGEGGIQTLQTSTSWLPAGTYDVRFMTTPGFAMTLQDTDEDLGISIREGHRVLHQAEADISADPAGTAEEAYAAVLADAAELTVRPERVAGLLAPAEQVAVDYGADGTVYTRLSGSFDTAGQEAAGKEAAGEPGSSAVLPAGSFVLYLDDYYRPLRIEITGLIQGVTSTITAVNTQWGTRPLS
ncbi:hypothetical protein [Arthrobacter sp. zg-Y877]|uniref:hypothetical protein n=1 Tax=Arthrobacter sp. zg-Y877 TaxID=3049074 RepID=UPI0025A3EB36|nr:hypothetical protein [Arthrobacter sp. zg-Y877]MDM7989267.1 hypothetical protein [Arthrobacter sp. zg-Y877]